MKSCKILTVGLVCWSLVAIAGCGSDTFEGVGAVGAPVTRDGPLAIDDVTPRRGVVGSETVVMIRGKGALRDNMSDFLLNSVLGCR